MGNEPNFPQLNHEDLPELRPGDFPRATVGYGECPLPEIGNFSELDLKTSFCIFSLQGRDSNKFWHFVLQLGCVHFHGLKNTPTPIMFKTGVAAKSAILLELFSTCIYKVILLPIW
jgi:hypothetical protein